MFRIPVRVTIQQHSSSTACAAALHLRLVLLSGPWAVEYNISLCLPVLPLSVSGVRVRRSLAAEERSGHQITQKCTPILPQKRRNEGAWFIAHRCPRKPEVNAHQCRRRLLYVRRGGRVVAGRSAAAAAADRARRTATTAAAAILIVARTVHREVHTTSISILIVGCYLRFN